MTFFLCFIAGTALWQGFAWFPRLSATVAITAALYLLVARHRAAALMLMAGFTLALVRAPEPPPINWDNPMTITGYFSGPARNYQWFNVQHFIADSTEPPVPSSFSVLSRKQFQPGQPVRLSLKMTTPWQRGNPGAIDRKIYARLVQELPTATEAKVHAQPAMAFVAELRQSIAAEMDATMPPREAALAKAVTVGIRQGMPDDLNKAFQRSGLAHLLSISGTHFGLFSFIVFMATRLTLGLLPHRWLLALTMRLSIPQAAGLITLPMTLFYLALSGGSTPSIRAFVMTALFLFGLLISARGNWPAFLSAAAFILVLMDPQVIASLSFLMSFSAVLYIGLALRRPKAFELPQPAPALPQPPAEPTPTPPEPGEPDLSLPEPAGHIPAAARALPAFQEEMEPRGPVAKVLNVIALKPLMLTLAATLGVLPILAHWFHQISLVSPGANMLVTGFAGFVLVPTSIANAMAYTLTGKFLLAPVLNYEASAVIALTEWFASPAWAVFRLPPLPIILVPLYYACTLPWLMLRRRWLLPLLAVPFVAYAAFSVSAMYDNTASITFLDTGASDAAVATLPGGRTIVMDTGRTGTELTGYLRHEGVEDIDVLMLTHKHNDHTGGAAKLARYYNVRELWLSPQMELPAGLANIPVRRLSAGDVIDLGMARATVLHPAREFAPTKGNKSVRANNGSLVIRLEVKGGSSVLLTGDLQAEGIAALDKLAPAMLKSDALKLPHHGKRARDSRAAIKTADPSLVIQTGPPTHRFVASDVLNTQDMGAIQIDLTRPTPRVKTYFAYALSWPGSLRQELDNIVKLFATW